MIVVNVVVVVVVLKQVDYYILVTDRVLWLHLG